MKKTWEEGKGKRALDIILDPNYKQPTAKEVIEMEDLQGKVEETKEVPVKKVGRKTPIILASDVINLMTEEQKTLYNMLVKAREEKDEKSQFKARRMLRKSGIYLSGGSLNLQVLNPVITAK